MEPQFSTSIISVMEDNLESIKAGERLSRNTCSLFMLSVLSPSGPSTQVTRLLHNAGQQKIGRKKELRRGLSPGPRSRSRNASRTSSGSHSPPAECVHSHVFETFANSHS